MRFRQVQSAGNTEAPLERRSRLIGPAKRSWEEAAVEWHQLVADGRGLDGGSVASVFYSVCEEDDWNVTDRFVLGWLLFWGFFCLFFSWCCFSQAETHKVPPSLSAVYKTFAFDLKCLMIFVSLPVLFPFWCELRCIRWLGCLFPSWTLALVFPKQPLIRA